jgi:DNA-binding protein YbaB
MDKIKIQEFHRMIHDVKNEIYETHQDPDGIISIEINGHLEIKKVKILLKVTDQKLEQILPALINSSIQSVSMKIKGLIEVFQRNLSNQ